MRKRTPVGLAPILLVGIVMSWTGCQEPFPPEFPPSVPTAATEVIAVQTRTHGVDLDADGYVLEVDGSDGPTLTPSDRVTIALADGDHTLELTDIAVQCVVDGSNPRVITVRGSPLNVSFEVSCGATLYIEMVSDEALTGTPGQPLEEPLAVRVTDTRDQAVEGVAVSWRVLGGDATLREGFSPESDPMLLETSTATNQNGVARVPFTPLAFERFEVVAAVRAGETPARFRVDATDPRASLTIVSGSGRRAKAGAKLDDPFVAVVTDGSGAPAGPLRVAWSVEAGDGYLGLDELGDRVLHDTVWTDPDGLARASLTPTWFGPVEVSAEAVGTTGSPLVFTADASDAGASLSLVSGDRQEGKTGEPLPDLLVVRATDGLGAPAANVRVSWGASSSTYTNEEGLAATTWSPGSLGRLSRDARLDGTDATVTFTAEVNVLVIRYYGVTLGYPPVFHGVAPCDESLTCEDEVVPLGTAVEWLVYPLRARIVTTSRPWGSASIDSGEMQAGERFQFVPDATGVWEYEDLVKGTTGVLRVQ